MLRNLLSSVNQIYEVNILEYIKGTFANPASLILTVIDLAIVIIFKNSRSFRSLQNVNQHIK